MNWIYFPYRIIYWSALKFWIIYILYVLFFGHSLVIHNAQYYSTESLIVSAFKWKHWECRAQNWFRIFLSSCCRFLVRTWKKYTVLINEYIIAACWCFRGILLLLRSISTNIKKKWTPTFTLDFYEQIFPMVCYLYTWSKS